MELWQAEWCPYSHRVRQRLTELGVDFVARQVPADRAERAELQAATAGDSIPVLVDDEGGVHRGADEALAYLARFPERPDAARHREMAAVDVPTFDEVARAGSD